MNPDRWERIQDLFSEAVALGPAKREAYLAALRDDDLVVAEVRSLLEAHERGGRLDRVRDHLGALAAPEVAETPAPRRVGPYAVLRPIAHGGMGSVYLAERDDGQARYRVALKLLRRDLDSDDLRRRFFAERQILARITHPNIARLLDAGITDEGRPYFVMEVVEGAPLDRYCDDHRLDIPARLELFRTVCEAVQHAHRHLVVHRDLKPDNILVAADGTVKLLDFGIAKALDAEAFPEAGRTRTGVRLLTPEYASPEQLRGEAVTTASDVYQLGLLLYVLLTGARPQLRGAADGTHHGPGATREITRPSLAVASLTHGPGARDDATAPDSGAVAAARGTTPERLRRRLTGDLDNIVLRALREEPERRYASAEQLGDDLRRHLAGLPVTARAETFSYLAAKFVRRHRAAVAAASVAIVLLFAFGVGMAAQARRVARERDRAEHVSALLLDLFRSASPDVSRGDTITVVQVLARGVERVRRDLQGQPDLQGVMFGTIAEVYQALGQIADATALARVALPLNRAANGPGHPATIRNLWVLGDLLASTGELDSAMRYAEEAAVLARRYTGRRSEATGEALFLLSGVLQSKGDLTAARDTMRRVITVARARGDSGRALLASALVNLGWLDDAEGRWDSAEAYLREALSIRRAVLRPDDPDLLRSLSALAALLTRRGALDEADSLVAEAVAKADALYPSGHAFRAEGALLEAQLLNARGDARGAERRMTEALATYRRVYGDRSAAVAATLNDLGLLRHYGLGDPAGAEPLFRESAGTYAELRGPTDLWVAMVQSNLAISMFAQGRLAEARTVFAGSVPLMESRLAPDDERLGLPLLNYGLVLTMLGEPAAAEPRLRRALAIERGRRAAGDVRIARAEAGLGACLVELGRYDEAESLLLDARRVFADVEEEGPYPTFTSSALAKLYTQLDRPADAARFRPEP